MINRIKAILAAVAALLFAILIGLSIVFLFEKSEQCDEFKVGDVIHLADSCDWLLK